VPPGLPPFFAKRGLDVAVHPLEECEEFDDQVPDHPDGSTRDAPLIFLEGPGVVYLSFKGHELRFPLWKLREFLKEPESQYNGG
jgi:hypothetical protein